MACTCVFTTSLTVFLDVTRKVLESLHVILLVFESLNNYAFDSLGEKNASTQIRPKSTLTCPAVALSKECSALLSCLLTHCMAVNPSIFLFYKTGRNRT